jgi:hypothetical protein
MAALPCEEPRSVLPAGLKSSARAGTDPMLSRIAPSMAPWWFTPQCVTPITNLAVHLSLVAIGAALVQIPCRHGPPRAHRRCRIYDCRRTPAVINPDQLSLLRGESNTIC